jgi:hypothetical protein
LCLIVTKSVAYHNITKRLILKAQAISKKIVGLSPKII